LASKPGLTKAVIKRVPIRRWDAGEDFAGIAVYLASDASHYHTGDSFVIDGGYTRFLLGALSTPHSTTSSVAD
jgi:NAD(P)-dependent dehydrogenase (short-subunit alcohol dehydrogenase family)